LPGSLSQYLASWASDNVVPGVVFESQQGDMPAGMALLLRWDDGVYLAIFQLGIVRRMCITGIGGYCLDATVRVRLGTLNLFDQLPSFTRFACGYLHINHNAGLVVHGGVLLETRFHSIGILASSQRGLRVGFADPLGASLARRPGRVGLGFLCVVFRQDLFGMLLDQAFPTDIGANECGVNMYRIAIDETGIDTGLYGFLENTLESFRPPALTKARQRAVMRQLLVQAKAGEPTDADVHARLAHQLAVMHDAMKKTGQHEPDCCLRINARAAHAIVVEIADFIAKPRHIHDLVNASQDIVIGHQVPKRAGHKKIVLRPIPFSEHIALPPQSD